MKVYNISERARLFRLFFFLRKWYTGGVNFWFRVLLLYIAIVETEAVTLVLTPGIEDEE